MNVLELHLSAFGPFTNKVLDFSESGRPAPMVMVYGKNEAGKSSTLRAMEDLRFEIPARSSDDFVHNKTKLRIGAKLADRTGAVHHLVRRKGNKDTLLSYSDDFAAELAPTSEAIAMMLTAGLNREEFKTMYGLDHARLRQGAQELLKGSGNVGSALFTAASGAKSIGQLLSQLEERAKAIYAKNAKSGLINKALKDYTDSQSELGRLAVKPRAWAEAKKTHDQAIEALETTKRDAQAVNRRLMGLKDIGTARLPVEQKNAAQQVLNALTGVAVLPAEFGARRVAIQARLKTLTETENQIHLELEEVKNKLALVEEDPDAIAHEHQIADLKNRSSLLQQAVEQESQARLEVELAETDANQAQQAVNGLGLPETGHDVPANAQQILAKANQAFLKTNEISREVRRLQSAELPAQEEPDAAVIGQLRHIALQMKALEPDARRAGDLSAQVQNAENELSRRIEAIGLSQLDAQPPMLAGEVQAAINSRAEAASDVQTVKSDLENATRAREQAEAHLNSLLAGGQVVTRDAVTSARAQRDLGWRLVRDHMIGTQGPSIESEAFRSGMALDDAYWKAVQEADKLADALAANAEAAARVAQSQVALTAAQQTEARLQSKLHQALEYLHAIADTWTQRANAAGLAGMQPEDTLAWLGEFSAIKNLNDSINASKVELNKLVQNLTKERDEAIGFLESLGHTWSFETTPKLANIFEVANAMVEQMSTQMQAAAAQKAVAIERAQRLSDFQFELKEATDAWEKSHAQALVVLEFFGLTNAGDEATAYGRAQAAVELVDALKDANTKLNQARARVHALESTIANFEAEASSLTGAIGLNLPSDTSTGAKIEALQNRLNKALASQQKKIHLDEMHAAATQRLATATKQMTALNAELTDMCATAGVSGPENLPEVEQQNDRRRQAQIQLEEAQAQLMGLTSVRNEGLAAIEAKVAAEDWSLMDEAQAACQRELEEMEHQRNAQTAAVEAARQALKAIDSGDNAAYASSQMDAAATAVRGQVGAWAQARLARALLNEAIKRFREKAQGPMLSLASGYFSQMTGGDFTGLTSDDDGPTPTLMASRAVGPAVGLDFLSEGTCDQVYLSLRMAALDLRQQAGVFMPVVLDDVLMTSDDARASNILKAIKAFSARHQVLIFTHHEHLTEVGRTAVPDLKLVQL